MENAGLQKMSSTPTNLAWLMPLKRHNQFSELLPPHNLMEDPTPPLQCNPTAPTPILNATLV